MSWNRTGCVATAVGDFNGDGIPDLVATTGAYPSPTFVFLGGGNGPFTQSSTLSQIDLGSTPVGDFNGDGKQDILSQTGSSLPTLDDRVSVKLGNGDGTFQVSTQLSAVNACCQAIAGAPDVNADGKPDLVFLLSGYFGGAVGVDLGEGDGTFQAGLTYPTNNSILTSLGIADFNGDGKLDLAAGGSGGVSILLGNGNGSFQAPAVYGLGTQAQAVADFNNDGKLDIAGASWNLPLVGVNISYGNGDGTFGFPNLIAENSSVLFSSAMVTADFNHDGNADFAMIWDFNNVFRPVTTTIAVFLGDGHGNFTQHNVTVDSYGAGLAEGDFDGDGIVDLAVTLSTELYFGTGYPSPVSDTVAVLLGNGDGTFKPPVYYSAGPLPNAIAVADLNEDGIQDIVTSNVPLDPNVGGTLSILLGKGDGTFQSAITYDGGNGGPIAIADFNGDGLPDLATGTEVIFNTTAGVGKQPAAALSVSSVNFGVHPINSSNSNSVTLTNTGNAPLNVAGLAIMGADPGQFGQSNNCGVLPANSSCTITVQFTPSRTGNLAATLSVVDNALDTPQVISLSGSGSDFALSPASANLAINAGATGTVPLTVTPVSGFAQAVTFSCSGLPSEATCTFSPSTVTPSGSGTNTVLTVATTAPSGAAMLSPLRYFTGFSTTALVLCFLPLVVPKSLRRQFQILLSVFALLSLGACGGGGATSQHNSNPGTPPGTYTVTISAVSGSSSPALTHNATLTLVVK